MCGLIGIISKSDAAAHAIEGLYAQQHRGREAAGIATADGRGIHVAGGLGLIEQVFPEGRSITRELPGVFAIGHVRYSTVSKDDRNAALYQPIRGMYGDEPFCLAHNGNITNAAELMGLVDPAKLETTVDTEIVARLLERAHTGSLVNDLRRVFGQLRGSYSFLFLFRDEIIAARDPSGNRPLSIGGNEFRVVLASETCAFETLNVEKLADVAPGTMVLVDKSREVHEIPFGRPTSHEQRCSFEPVYFSHPASEPFDVPVTDFRLRLGEALERESPAQGVDVVLGVPDSATAIAIGYGRSGRSGTFVPALIRHHHAGGRTFIHPHQDRREAAAKRKFQVVRREVAGKSVVLVDDSIVRATTMKVVVQRLRLAGAREVHVRSAYPPIRFSCLYGIDTPRRQQLIASNRTEKEIGEFIGANSLAYLSGEKLLSVLGGSSASWCTACIYGRYWHEDVHA